MRFNGRFLKHVLLLSEYLAITAKLKLRWIYLMIPNLWKQITEIDIQALELTTLTLDLRQL